MHQDFNIQRKSEKRAGKNSTKLWTLLLMENDHIGKELGNWYLRSCGAQENSFFSATNGGGQENVFVDTISCGIKEEISHTAGTSYWYTKRLMLNCLRNNCFLYQARIL